MDRIAMLKKIAQDNGHSPTPTGSRRASVSGHVQEAPNTSAGSTSGLRTEQAGSTSSHSPSSGGPPSTALSYSELTGRSGGSSDVEIPATGVVNMLEEKRIDRMIKVASLSEPVTRMREELWEALKQMKEGKLAPALAREFYLGANVVGKFIRLEIDAIKMGDK